MMMNDFGAEFRIAIVGRPNVGKSTLYNRLTGRQHALVHDRPGVTRDRREGAGQLAGLRFRLIDTAGLEEASKGSLEDRMRQQTEYAIAHSDLTLLLFDARAGLTEADVFFANAIRRSGAGVIVVGNKCEGKAGQDGLTEAWRLGLGQAVGVSAEHGEGLGDLYDALVAHAEEMGKLDALMGDEGREEFDASAPLRIAIIGRPNMGKSTLANHLIGEERMLTGAEAGITRDAIEMPFTYAGRDMMLVDTAGMRRKARIDDQLEKAMVDDALRAIRFAQLCILLIDSRANLHKQDLAIARLVVEEGRGLIIGANMWDVAKNKDATKKELRHKLDESLAQVKTVPLVPISAQKGTGIGTLMHEAFTIYERWNRRIATASLNRWLEGKLEAHPPPLVEGRRLRIRYATQVKTRPPSFAFFVSRPAELPAHYMRYLAAGLRADFDLDGVPLRLMMRKGKNPYVN